MSTPQLFFPVFLVSCSRWLSCMEIKQRSGNMHTPMYASNPFTPLPHALWCATLTCLKSWCFCIWQPALVPVNFQHPLEPNSLLSLCSDSKALIAQLWGCPDSGSWSLPCLLWGPVHTKCGEICIEGFPHSSFFAVVPPTSFPLHPEWLWHLGNGPNQGSGSLRA